MDKLELRTIDDTMALGNQLGRDARTGSVIALCGGLGAGKTHLAKGIVAGAGGNPEAVSSPTFALVQEYQGRDLPLFHFDFYRLNAADEVLALGWDEYLESGGICIVEWADLFPHLLPSHTQWWHLSLSAGGQRHACTGSVP